MDNEAEGYVPEYAETIKRLQAAARSQVLPIAGIGDGGLDDPQNLLAEGVIDRAEAIEAADKKRKVCNSLSFISYDRHMFVLSFDAQFRVACCS